MKKFCRKKIAIALACSSILGGKSSTTLYPQTVEAAGRSVESSSKGFVNWVKNHKWPVIGGALAIATVAVVTTVLGVKYLGKKDQKNPDEQESKIDGEDNKQSQVPGEKKEADVKKDGGKKKFFEKNKEIIDLGVQNGEFMVEANKKEFGDGLLKLKNKFNNAEELAVVAGKDKDNKSKILPIVNKLKGIFSGELELESLIAVDDDELGYASFKLKNDEKIVFTFLDKEIDNKKIHCLTLNSPIDVSFKID